VEVKGNTIDMLVQFDIFKPLFEASKYQSIRAVYEQIVSHEAEQIVLAKYTPPPVPTATAPRAPTRSSKKK
jgi:hypothetical protein